MYTNGRIPAVCKCEWALQACVCERLILTHAREKITTTLARWNRALFIQVFGLSVWSLTHAHTLTEPHTYSAADWSLVYDCFMYVYVSARMHRCATLRFRPSICDCMGAEVSALSEWMSVDARCFGRHVYVHWVCVCVYLVAHRAGFGFSVCCTGGPRQTSDAMDF